MLIPQSTTALDVLLALQSWYRDNQREGSRLYGIFGAIRGPDAYGGGAAKSQYTNRIRATVFGTLFGDPIRSREEALRLMKAANSERISLPRGSELNHYYFHLETALSALSVILPSNAVGSTSSTSSAPNTVRVSKIES